MMGMNLRGGNVSKENNSTIQKTRLIPKKFNLARFIIAIILVGVIAIIANNFLGPTIAPIDGYIPYESYVDMFCASQNCPGCQGTMWDTRGCAECMEICPKKDHPISALSLFGLLLVILSALFLTLQSIDDEDGNPKAQIWLEFLLLVLGIVIILLGLL